MWPQKVLHTVHFNDLINQWGGILTPSRGSDEFMMLLWILWTRITVPDSRISSASGTVNPSHPTPRARAGRFTVHFSCTRQTAAIIWRATPNIRQKSASENKRAEISSSAVISGTKREEAGIWSLRRIVIWSCEGFVFRLRTFEGTAFCTAPHFYADFFVRRRIWLGLLIEKDFWLPQQVFPLLNYFIELLFFLTFKEPSMKSRSGCWQLHINGYEIRNTLTITEISLHLNRARLLIRRIYCFPNTFASRSRRFRTPKVEGKTPKVARADSVTVLQMCSGSVLTIV